MLFYIRIDIFEYIIVLKINIDIVNNKKKRFYDSKKIVTLRKMLKN